MDLQNWARRWGVSEQAVIELQQIFGVARKNESTAAGRSEASVLNEVRLEASNRGIRLWRNNVGATYTKDGAFLRYGLANDSAAMNRTVKSADLIGIRPVTVTQEMVGYTFGQFISREIKAPGWKYAGNEREKAQLAWAVLISALGGNACFAAGEGTL